MKIKRTSYLKKIGLTAAIFLGILIAMSTSNVQIVNAETRAYDTPCSQSDWENAAGTCCPQGTTNVHSMCLNSDEMQKKDEVDSRILNCAGGVAKGFITGNPRAGLSSCVG
jgi:hypothetical protein